MSDRYFEDFAVGQVHKPSGRIRVEKPEIIDFARKYDPQPFHLDDEAGRKSIFGRLVASGWHTAALTMRLVADSEYRPAGGTIGLGFDGLRWPMPVSPGDELRIESEVLDMRPSKSRPDRGLLKIRTRTLNQNGQVVQELIANALVPRRPAAAEQR
jgi:acyl dehydratase